LTRRERPEILLDAVFLWMIPFPAALSMADIASLSAADAPSMFLPATSAETFLCRVFSFFRTDLFLSSCASVCLALFMADLFFFTAFCAKTVPPVRDLLNCRFTRKSSQNSTWSAIFRTHLIRGKILY